MQNMGNTIHRLIDHILIGKRATHDFEAIMRRQGAVVAQGAKSEICKTGIIPKM